MKTFKRIIAILLAVLLVLPNIGGLVHAEESGNTEVLRVERLSGAKRIDTSVEVSKKAYPDGSDNVVIAGFNGEVDALTGTLLAAVKKAPLLISETKTL